MKYYLSKNYTLESWQDTSLRAVSSGGTQIRLSREECNFLLSCDGSEQEADEAAENLIRKGIITSDENEGGEVVFDFHEYICRNGAIISITGRCNYRCRHCIAAEGVGQTTAELSLEECKSIFSQMAELSVKNYWLTGGEPLLHPHFREIIADATEKGLSLRKIFTNGSLITPELLNYMKSLGQRPEIAISFDGLGTHEWMRCVPGAEEKTLSAIDLVTESHFPVTVNINVNNATAPRLVETCRYLISEHKCKSIRFIPTSPSPRWEAMADKNDNISSDGYFALALEALRIFGKESPDVDFTFQNIPFAHLPGYESVLERLKNPPQFNPKRKIASCCRRIASNFFISHDGRVLPCSAFENNSIRFGIFVGDDTNIKKHSLRDILTSSEYSRFSMETAEERLGSMENCRNCKWVGFCYGGCPLYSLGNKLSVYDGNPVCDFYRNGWADKYIELLDNLKKSE